MHWSHAAAWVCLLGLAGCVGPSKTSFDDPVAVMLDRRAYAEDREAAAAQAEAEQFDSPARIAALRTMVWERGYPAQWSNYAVDQLVAIDEAEAKEHLARVIVLIEDWATVRHVLKVAVDRQWRDFVPAIVRHYALRTGAFTDEERPERAAIEALRPGEPIERVVLEVFAGEALATIKQRAAAWALLSRLVEDEAERRAMLLGIETRNALVLDMQAAARELYVVPSSMETVTWLRIIATPQYRPFWKRSTLVVAKLNDEQRRGLQLRHLPLLMHVDDVRAELLERSRAQLLAEVGAAIDAQPHYTEGGLRDDHPQTLTAHDAKLSWGDALALRVAVEMLRDRRMVEAWFAQADEDVKDTSTELGGLVRLDRDGRPFPYGYAPLIRSHDRKYIPPKELIIDAYTALMHYHYHAQDYTNREASGPGVGDMEFATRHQINAIVLTFIDENTLNADYYQAPDVVIDLGVIRR